MSEQKKRYRPQEDDKKNADKKGRGGDIEKGVTKGTYKIVEGIEKGDVLPKRRKHFK